MTVRRTHTLAAAAGAVAWTFYEADDFRVPRIAILLSSAPTSAGNITVKVDSVNGAAFDHVIRTVNPVGQTAIIIEGLNGFVFGDKILVEYANPDNRTISGSAVCELQIPTILPSGTVTENDGVIRSSEAKYRRYYHSDLGSFSPGASGATWTNASANQMSGWLCDAATEYLWAHFDIHADWDGTSKPVLEIVFTTQDSNTGGNDADTVDLQAVATYRQPASTLRTQTVTFNKVIGKAAQYTVHKCEIELDPIASGNPIAAGDAISVRLAVLATGDLTRAVINSISFYYQTTHIGVEESDV